MQVAAYWRYVLAIRPPSPNLLLRLQTFYLILKFFARIFEA